MDGFALLTIEGEDPPRLRLWSLSYAGALREGAAYPSSSDAVLDPTNCEPTEWPILPGPVDPSLAIDYERSAGCACALEPSGAADCIARDRDGSPVVLRFAPDAPRAEIRFRAREDPFLLDIKGLITGP